MLSQICLHVIDKTFPLATGLFPKTAKSNEDTLSFFFSNTISLNVQFQSLHHCSECGMGLYMQRVQCLCEISAVN